MLEVLDQAGKDEVSLSLGLRQADTRVQATHQRHGISFVPDIVIDDRSVDIYLVAGGENRTEVKAVRQHADHGDGGPIQVDSLSHDPAIAAILPLPECMAEQHRRTAVVQALLCREQATQRRFDSQCLKEIAAYN